MPRPWRCADQSCQRVWAFGGCSRSFQCLNVISELCDLFVGKFEVGHLGPDFDLLRIAEPTAQIFRGVRQDPSAELFAARKMGQVGSVGCGSYCALDRVAVYASHLLEQSTTFLRVIARRLRCRGKLSLFPFFKFRLRFGDKQKVHPGVLCPAKLCAKAEARRGFIGLNPEMIRMP